MALAVFAPAHAQQTRGQAFGEQPVNFSLGVYYNLVKPEYGADWTVKSTVAFIF